MTSAHFKKTTNEKAHHIIDAATELLNEGKKKANDIYKEEAQRIAEAEDLMKNYSEDLTHKVKENPLTSLLIAGGIGYLLAKIMKK